MRSWLMEVYVEDWSPYTGKPIMSVTDPAFIPRAGDFIRTDHNSEGTSYTSRPVRRIELDYRENTIHVIVG